MNLLTISRNQFDDSLRGLLTQRGEAAIFSLGCARWEKNIEWIAHTPQLLSLRALTASHGEWDIAALIVSETPTDALHQLWEQFRDAGSENWRVFVAVGVRQAQGQLSGIVLTPSGKNEQLHQLRLPGAGMHRFQLHENSRHELSYSPSFQVPQEMLNRWSRTIGALGEGVWRRLVSLNYGIVGCGRTGSLIATGLFKLGVQKVTLLDPDVVECHNLGEMDAVSEADIGRAKSEALAASLNLLTHSQVHTLNSVPASVTTFRALAAVKPCDILICCVDNDAARLAAGIIATLYLKPLLDIGTGIFYPSNTDSHVVSLSHSHAHQLPSPRCMQAHVYGTSAQNNFH